MEEKKRVLVADDDPDQVILLNHHLKKWGFDTVTVESRQEAERFLEKERPDLAILDLMMEEEDSGFILAHRIKQCHPGVPVIIVTAVTAEKGISFDLSTPENRTWIKADYFLEKGYRPEQLKLIIKRLLG
jgi:CheY-like chemotaxis protein